MPPTNIQMAGMEQTQMEKEFGSSEEVDLPHLDCPDGGLRAWLVVLGVWLMQFCTFGYANAYGVYNDFYVRDYLAENYSSSQISWIGSVQLFLTLSGGLIAGRGFDTGYFYHLMIGGSLIFVFCLFMLSLTQPGQYYQVFLAHGLGVGIATGLSYVPGMAVLSQYFHRRRAIAMGIATTGSAVGGALHPIMLNKLFYGRAGFHGGVRASAGMCLGLLVIALFLVRPRFLPTKNEISTASVLRDFMKDPPYVIMCCGTFLVYTGLYFPIFFLQLNSIKIGIDANLAFYTIAILNGASVFGRIFPNMLVNRVGVLNIVIPCTFITGILVFCPLAIKDVAGTMIFSILYGFFSGAYAGLVSPMISSLARNNSELGARLGICFAFTGIGGLIGTPISGALLTTSFIWWRPFLFSGLCVFLGTLFFFVARYLSSRAKGTHIL